MREKARIDNILNELKILWEKNQDIRFFQLIHILEHKLDLDDSFYYEDDNFLIRLKELNDDKNK